MGARCAKECPGACSGCGGIMDVCLVSINNEDGCAGVSGGAASLSCASPSCIKACSTIFWVNLLCVLLCAAVCAYYTARLTGVFRFLKKVPPGQNVLWVIVTILSYIPLLYGLGVLINYVHSCRHDMIYNDYMPGAGLGIWIALSVIFYGVLLCVSCCSSDAEKQELPLPVIAKPTGTYVQPAIAAPQSYHNLHN